MPTLVRTYAQQKGVLGDELSVKKVLSQQIRRWHLARFVSYGRRIHRASRRVDEDFQVHKKREIHEMIGNSWISRLISPLRYLQSKQPNILPDLIRLYYFEAPFG
ncbi:hypothetical protein LIA77_00003 [Sarocladium implicatum]|nr:hypothetical protein LIA77_00003 [Sarocladium implicatum]